MNPLRLQLIQDFVEEVGDALTDLNCKVSDFQEKTKEGSKAKISIAWGDLTLAACHFARRARSWYAIRPVLESVLPLARYPDHRPLWDTAAEIWGIPDEERTAQDSERLLSELEKAALAVRWD